MRDLELLLNDVKDPVVRENFDRILRASRELVMGGFIGRFLTLTVEGAVTNFTIAHGLAFVPTDVLQTSLIGAGAITFNFASFTRESISITTTGACVVRCFVGTYQE